MINFPTLLDGLGHDGSHQSTNRWGLATHPSTLSIGGLILLMHLAGCGTSPAPRLSPAPGLDPSQLVEPTPQAETPSRRGNPGRYTIKGQTYTVLRTSQGYRERGSASWYGPGFHGQPTSSGDVYDMYAITAAHKTLPIPTYVRVVHQQTGRSVVVRVNDRGPFVEERIIDLSYAAATKLGMVEEGVAPVEVVALPPYQSLPDEPAFQRYVADPPARTPRTRVTQAPSTTAPARPACTSPPASAASLCGPPPASPPRGEVGGGPFANATLSTPSTPRASTSVSPSIPTPIPPVSWMSTPSVTPQNDSRATTPSPQSQPTTAHRPEHQPAETPQPVAAPPTYLYAGHFALSRNAEVLKQRLARVFPYPIQTEQAGVYYWLRIGPVAPQQVEQVTVQLARMGIATARWVAHSPNLNTP